MFKERPPPTWGGGVLYNRSTAPLFLWSLDSGRLALLYPRAFTGWSALRKWISSACHRHNVQKLFRASILDSLYYLLEH